MSSNTNLPAGFSLTTLNGIQCTRVPRSLTSIQDDAASSTTTSPSSTSTSSSSSSSSTSPSSTSTSTSSSSSSSSSFSSTSSSTAAQLQNNSNVVAVTQASSSSASSANSTSTLASSTTSSTIQQTTSQASQAAASSSPLAVPKIEKTSAQQEGSAASSTAAAFNSAIPTRSSIGVFPIAQSEINVVSITTASSNNGNSTPSDTASTISAASHSSSAAAITSLDSSHPKISPAPVIGGVLGGVAIIGLLGLIFWLFRKMKRRGRESSLTRLATGTRDEFYGDDRDECAGSGSEKLKQGIGSRAKAVIAGFGVGLACIRASLRSNLGRERSLIPTVNLNRGNSQFLDGSMPPYSRNASAIASRPEHFTIKERLANWWEATSMRLPSANQKRQSVDPFRINEKLVAMEDRKLHIQNERRRTSSDPPELGSLGLDFNNFHFQGDDPFADPIAASTNSWSHERKELSLSNPFDDPVASPRPSMQKPSTYIRDVYRSREKSVDDTPSNTLRTKHRSRGQSIGGGPAFGGYMPPTAIVSRHSSTIRDSYRDTFLSTSSDTTREKRGRSDPFDLERPELWHPKMPENPTPVDNAVTTMSIPSHVSDINAFFSKSSRPSTTTYAGHSRNPLSRDLYPHPLRISAARNVSVHDSRVRDSDGAQPRVISVQTPRIVSGGTYGSRYSSQRNSDTTSLGGDWEDLGPDLWPGSGTGSMHEVPFVESCGDDDGDSSSGSKASAGNGNWSSLQSSGTLINDVSSKEVVGKAI